MQVRRNIAMLGGVRLRFGASPGSQPVVFNPGVMTVFVGPNNSGKSLVLRELFDAVRYEQPSGRKIVEQVEVGSIPASYVLSYLSHSGLPIDTTTVDTNSYASVMVRTGSYNSHTSVHVHIGAELESSHDREIYTGPHQREFAMGLILILDGQTRLGLLEGLPSGNLQQPPSNLLMALLRDDHAREAIRDVVHDAFGYYFVVDPTEMSMLRVRMSEHRPSNILVERSFTEMSIAYHQQATPLSEFSDGVRAFIGLIASMYDAEFKTCLIDEPEAFLHPPLARKLGTVLTLTAAERGKHVFASTHSADFLMGCIQSGHPVNVIRLTYQNKVPGARILSGDDIQRSMRDPLLRSTNVISALFHRGAVVCEGDNDRAFYEEINLRLLNVKKGAADTIFLHANGKQKIDRVVRLLRTMGIPAAAITDLDILKEGDLASLLRAANVPATLVDTWSQLKRRTADAFKQQNIDMKEEGIAALDRESQESAKSLIASAGEYGVFIVPVGEVERWLPELGVQVGARGSKAAWLVSMFERLGTDPDDASYIHPASDDVWEFIAHVARWVGDPNRKGIPA